MKKYWLLCIVCWLSACSTMPPAPKPKNLTQAATAHAKQMQALQTFTIKGRIGIVTNTHEGGSASMLWEQQKDHYHVHLSAPLGQTIFDLTGNANGVLLQTADGQRTTATTPEALLALKTGWHLPVSHLVYWVRGIPVPDVPLFTQYDDYGRLSQLNKAPDWQIQYTGYQTVQGLDLPERITLTSRTVTLKLVITRWQIG